MFDEALRYLLSLGHETLAIKLGLTNTRRLLEALRNPQRDFPSVQLAGTNGKGSVAVMLESIARTANIRTGLYTSPHLTSITERIRIGDGQISRDSFARAAAKVRATAERLMAEGVLEARPTFFEHVTAIALKAFSEERVSLAILETGMGGRLDATTTAEARTIGITQIALDHQEYLGQTLTEIAAEKAAIIRPGVAAVIAPQENEALDVILERCAACGVEPRMSDCQVKTIGSDDFGRLCVSFETKEDRYDEVLLGLRGRHQITNASVAIALAEALREQGFRVPKGAISSGLENARHPGRLDFRRLRGRRILFDGAHNAAGARALSQFLDEFVKTPITLMFGAMRDKNLAEISAALFPRARHLILTQPESPRAATPEMLAQYAPPGIDLQRLTLASSPGEALERAFKVTPDEGLICVTGSLYLVGEIMDTMDLEADV